MMRRERAPAAGAAQRSILVRQQALALTLVTGNARPAPPQSQTSPLTLLDGLRGLLESARGARSEQDIVSVLDAVTATIAAWLGFRSVVVNLYRPAWDDFICASVHGSPAVVKA